MNDTRSRASEIKRKNLVNNKGPSAKDQLRNWEIPVWSKEYDYEIMLRCIALGFLRESLFGSSDGIYRLDETFQRYMESRLLSHTPWIDLDSPAFKIGGNEIHFTGGPVEKRNYDSLVCASMHAIRMSLEQQIRWKDMDGIANFLARHLVSLLGSSN